MDQQEFSLSTLENCLELFHTVEDTHTLCPEISLLNIYPRETLAHVY